MRRRHEASNLRLGLVRAFFHTQSLAQEIIRIEVLQKEGRNNRNNNNGEFTRLNPILNGFHIILKGFASSKYPHTNIISPSSIGEIMARDVGSEFIGKIIVQQINLTRISLLKY